MTLPPISSLAPVTLLLVTALWVACGSDDGPSPPVADAVADGDVPGDEVVDEDPMNFDQVPMWDWFGHDDVAPDAAPDAVPDAAPDVAPDAAPDAVPDATPDTAPDALPDATPDVAADTGADVGSDVDAASPPAQSCTTGAGTCPESKFCLANGCGVGLSGVCTHLPFACSDDIVGTCGCDGETYGNPCLAHQAGVAVAGPGACPGSELDCEVAAPFGLGTGCDLTLGEYCMGGCDGQGFCKVKDTGCLGVDVAFVCSCANLTYASACLAGAAGTNIAHEGSCDVPDPEPSEPCGGVAKLACPEGKLCDITGCEDDAEGTCEKPFVLGEGGFLCFGWDPPECGCDDVTYDNRCQRILAGVAKKSDGFCGDNTCTLGVVGACGGSMYCSGSIGDCDGQGSCAAKSLVCIDFGAPPVCGCDGKTYTTSCAANQVEVPIQAYGSCP